MAFLDIPAHRQDSSDFYNKNTRIQEYFPKKDITKYPKIKIIISIK